MYRYPFFFGAIQMVEANPSLTNQASMRLMSVSFIDAAVIGCLRSNEICAALEHNAEKWTGN